MASGNLGTRNLFIVDDDPMMRDALSIVFTLAGYGVVVFADAETFLAAARARVPACVLLDLHLPDKSGVAVLKELNAHSYPAPVFIITSDGDLTIVKTARCARHCRARQRRLRGFLRSI